MNGGARLGYSLIRVIGLSNSMMVLGLRSKEIKLNKHKNNSVAEAIQQQGINANDMVYSTRYHWDA